MNEETKIEEQRLGRPMRAITTDAAERTVSSTQDVAPRIQVLEPLPKVHIGVASTAVVVEEQASPLFSTGEAKEMRIRWDAIQGSFVDEPRAAVQQADDLVSDAMKRLAEIFAGERAKLEGQWDREKTVSTEDLRLALRRYRSFFDRILAV